MNKMLIVIVFVIILIVFFSYSKFFKADDKEENKDKMKVTSVFPSNGKIPSKYTCDGENISVPLEVIDIPGNAKTLAIISDDPDAPSGMWVHWVVWNISVSGNSKTIEEGTSPGTEGITDFGSKGYGGPCPPSGTHRYFFKVYALDTELSLEDATKSDLEKAMKGHIIQEAELMGTYARV